MPSTYSPLRYPGGKSRFYSYVKELLIYNDLLGETYIEPFAGGAGLALKLLLNDDVKRIVINDFDPAVFSFWYSILYNTDTFCNLISDISVTRQEWNKQHDIYLQHNTYNRLELGFATFFLNRTNVSGVITGGIIGGKEQQGDYKIGARFNKDTLISKIKKIADRKEQIVLLNKDAKELIQPHQLRKFYKAFLNLDPPYVKKGAQLYKNAFCESDHRELYTLMDNCKRKWIVTYDICPLVADLYHSYRSSYLDVTYSIQSSKKAQEYIFFSNNLVLPNSIILRET